MQNKFIQVSETMISENHAEIKTHYLIIKISNKVFSTTFGKSIDFVKSVLQKSNTKKIIGWSLFIIAIVLVAWFFLRYKQTKKPRMILLEAAYPKRR